MSLCRSLPSSPTKISATLTEARPVRIKKMFGGLGFYLGDAFFGIADDDRVYFKVSPATVEKYESRGMGPWITPDFRNEKYREVPSEILADPAQLGEWMDEAAEVALQTAKPKKSR